MVFPSVPGQPPPTPPNPYHWETQDIGGSILSIDFAWDTTSLALTGITVFRDPTCAFTTILIGLGSDGSPDTTTRQVTVPAGTRHLNSTQLAVLASHGLATITDAQALQITAM